MELKNCIKCGSLFTYINSPICPKCVKAEEEVFLKVRKYIKDNPNSTIIEVSQETDVPVKKIYAYLREDRIEMINHEGMDLQCDRCGAEITKGRYCASCAEKISKEISEVMGSRETNKVNSTQNQKGIMHTYKNKKK